MENKNDGNNNFDCKKYLCKCKAKCCGPVPFAKKLYEDNKLKIVRPFIEIIEVEGFDLPNDNPTTMIIAMTVDGYCIFLGKDKRCNIYDERPWICRNYGLIPKLRCPYQKEDGSPRAREQRCQMIKKKRGKG